MANKKIIKNFATFGFGLTLALSAFGIANFQKAQVVNADAVDYSTTYTSNIDLTKTTGTKIYNTDKVKINDVDYPAVKLGSSGNGGSVTIGFPEGTQTLHFHIVAWNKKSGKIDVDGTQITVSEGVSGNSPYSTSKSPDTYYSSINVEGKTSVTFSSTVSGTTKERFVLFGVNAEAPAACAHDNLEVFSGAAPKCEQAGFKDCYYCEDCETYFEDAEATIEIGDEDAWLAWADEETGNGYIAPTGHTDLEAISYKWNGNKCTAFYGCTNEGCDQNISEETTAAYIKDTDATCHSNELGHFVATFEDVSFETQTTEANSYEVPDSTTEHNFDTPKYVWNGNKCTASKACINSGCNYVYEETVDATYVKDTDATCQSNEKGHYEVEFEDEAFEAQNTEANSYEVPDSTTEHSYGGVVVLWSDDHKTCSSMRSCTNFGCQETISETADGVYVSDTDATCTEYGKGHYEATFENPNLPKASTEANGITNVDAPKGHSYGEIVYTWDGNLCTATRTCSECGDVITHDESGWYVKDTDATCTECEKGHYEAEFDVENFKGNASTEANSADGDTQALNHSYLAKDVQYSINDDKITASIVCSREGCNEKIEETVTATYVKDTDATCTENEKGHYEATFENTTFGTYVGNANSIEKPDSALGHDYTVFSSYLFDKDNTAEYGCKGYAIYQCERCTAITYIEGVVSYAKDTDATCTENEKGHLIISFSDPSINQFARSANTFEKENSALGHDFGEPEYAWNDEKTAVTATRTCKVAGCNHSETETANSIYVKDTDATCTANEKGHYEATFTNPAFEKQMTEANSIELADTKVAHTYGGIISTWNDSMTKVTGTRSCICEGCDSKLTCEADATYVKDSDATCEENERGHYEAILSGEGFDNVKISTPTNGTELPNTALGHDYGSAQYTWNGDKCTASRPCTQCDSYDEETVTAKYVKDTDATCTANEKGHYEATFTNSAFAKQVTAANSVEKTNSKVAHSFGEVTYTWANNKCTAERSCTANGCNYKETETVDGVYVKDTDATCTANEKGHYEATFTNSAFAKQVTAANSEEKQNSTVNHSFGTPTYTWNNDKCTATVSCTTNGCTETVSETVTGTYVKDTDATTTVNEKGHYTVEFENSLFTANSTAANSVEKEGTKLPEPAPVDGGNKDNGEKKGCGGSLIASSAIVSVLATLGACLLAKKREEK